MEDLLFNYIQHNTDLIISVFITLSLSVIAGGAIGLERTVSGSPAGFRTHVLVCLASTLLTLISTHQVSLMADIPQEILRIDPTRMAQGIMTGIGFLGAGVIIKTGVTIRGLTTAASLWITAAMGILVGVEFYIAAALGTITILSTLVIFRWVESVIPTHHFGKIKIVVNNMDDATEEILFSFLKECNITPLKVSYESEKQGKYEYRITSKTHNLSNHRKLAIKLTESSLVTKFDVQSIRT